MPAALFFRFGVGASAFLLPLMLQLAFGLDALQLRPHHLRRRVRGAGGEAAGARLPAPLRLPAAADRQRRAGLGGAAGERAVHAGDAAFRDHRRCCCCGGFLRSLQFTSLSAITYAEVETRQVGSATGMASVGQQVSVSFGVAVGAMVVEAVGRAARAHGAGDRRFRGGVRGGGPDVDGLVAADAPPAGRCGGRDFRAGGAGGRAHGADKQWLVSAYVGSSVSDDPTQAEHERRWVCASLDPTYPLPLVEKRTIKKGCSIALQPP